MDQITLVATIGDETLAPKACANINQAFLNIDQYEAGAISRGIAYRSYAVVVNPLEHSANASSLAKVK